MQPAVRPLLAVAPMEGLTGVIFRQVHVRHFPGADQYFIPFVTPTTIPRFTERQLRELAPEVNAGVNAIPQLLTRREEDFIWAAKALADLGYREVNLNLGCPAGTVVAKGKGSGFLREPTELFYFLEKIFNADLPIGVSLKTRLGWADEGEFEAIAEIYNRFPVHCLTIHPRLKTDQYRGDVREAVFDQYWPHWKMPIGYNGDVVSVADVDRIQAKYPGLAQVMIGRALMADPALFRKLKGGAPATREEIVAFADDLFESYALAFDSWNNALMRMKEYWFYQLNLFEGGPEMGKSIFKTRSAEAFREALKPVIENLPLKSETTHAWYKPL